MGLKQTDTGHVAKAASVQEHPESKAPMDARRSQEDEREDSQP